ncbi:MAG: Fe-S cluster assembly protein SufD [Candidatus Hydrogenedentota bacterium]
MAEQHDKQHYLGDIARLEGPGVPEVVRDVRTTGAAMFRKTPFPHTKMEEWRQTNIAKIVNTRFETLVVPTGHGLERGDIAPFSYGAPDWIELVFVDGYYAQDLSCLEGLPDGAYAGSLWDALVSDNPAATQHLNKHLGDRNAFTHLNNAFLQDGAFVYIPKNTKVDRPIHLVFLTSAQRAENTASNPRHLIVADTGSQAAIVESYVSTAGATAYFNNVVVETALMPNASINRYKIVREGENGYHLATAEVHQDRDSRYTSFAFSLEGQIVRNQLCINLDGEAAACNLHGLVTNDQDRLVDNMVHVTHAKPHCNSRIAYKGILDGTSKGVFLGKVHVLPDAQQTDSDQLSQYMLLNEKATIDTKPQLEIYADDVKCTHGATVGAPPEQVIFYFRSRGIDEATARGMLTYGFADEIVGEVDLEPLRDALDAYVFDKYSPKNKARQY